MINLDRLSSVAVGRTSTGLQVQAFPVLVLSLFVVVYIAPLGLRPMVTPDEYRYAEIPREMLASRDWVTPHLDGFLYFEKPVLGYWLTAVSIALIGDSTLAVRLPAALAAGLTGFLVFWLLNREDKRQEVALLAPVILLTQLQFFCIGVFAVLDGPFTTLVTGTMACFFVAYTSTGTARQKVLLALAGICCGGAFLIKGLVAIAIPALSIFPFLVLQRRVRDSIRLAWIPCLTAVLTVLPWGSAILSRSPGFWPYFLVIEHLQRFLAPTSAQHPQPFWFFGPVFLVGALPWSPLIPAALAGLRAFLQIGRRPRSALVVFSICWFLASFVFFSLSSGKLATYILPIFPPFAILMTVGLDTYLRTRRRALWRYGAVLSASLSMLAALVLFIDRHALYTAADRWRSTVLIGALLISFLLTMVAARINRGLPAIKLFAASPLLAFFCLHLAFPVIPLAAETPGTMLERNAFRVRPDTVVVSDIATMHAACWTFKKQDILILDNPGELRFGVARGPSTDRHLTQDSIMGILAQSGAGRVLFVTEAATFDRYRHLLPKPELEESGAGLVVAEVILPPPTSTQTSSSGLTQPGSAAGA